MTEATEQSRLAPESALDRIIACTREEFATEYWGRNWRLFRAAELPSGFDDLFGPGAVDELASRRGMRVPLIRVVTQNGDMDTSEFTRGKGVGVTVDDEVAADKILLAMAGGATLVTQNLHRTWPPVVDFGARLSVELGHPVRINAYTTPPNNKGFAPHWDAHDVFVLQIAGSKRWVIHEPVKQSAVDKPLAHDPALNARVAEEPMLDTMLETGDVLYLPRGTVHAAEALGETSIHLTVGVPAVTRLDLIRCMLDTAAEDASLRESLPMGVDLTDPNVLDPELETTFELLRRCLDRAGTGNLALHLTSKLIERVRPEPIGPLEQLALVRRLDRSSKLRARSGLRLKRESVDGQIRLTRFERYIDFPPLVSQAIDLGLSGAVFTPADLPGLCAEDQLAFTRRLITEGLVVPAEE